MYGDANSACCGDTSTPLGNASIPFLVGDIIPLHSSTPSEASQQNK